MLPETWAAWPPLVGVSALDHARVSVRSGLQRGVAGWAVFMGLPCAGLSPELPGMAAAELTDRQVCRARTRTLAHAAGTHSAPPRRHHIT